MMAVGWGIDKNPEDFAAINNIEELEKQASAIQLDKYVQSTRAPACKP